MITPSTNIQYLKGVGPYKAKLLEKLGLSTVSDLVYYFPRAYLDRSNLKKINQLMFGERVVLYAKVERTEEHKTRGGMVIFKAVLSDGSGRIDALWFRRMSYRYDVLASLKKHINKGSSIFVTGIVDWEGIRVEEYEQSDELDNLLHLGRIVPVYPATEMIDSKFLRNLVKQALDYTLKDIYEYIPAYMIEKHKLVDIVWAVSQIHFPESEDAKEQAYARLTFDEFLLLELALLKERSAVIKNQKAHNYKLSRHLLTPFKEKMGFEFTAYQKKVINELFTDMRSKYPMNRLLQGDVGSGKTVVALSAMLLAVENKQKAVLLAPTEVLAEQHFISICNFTEGLNIRVALYTGSMKKREKDKVRKLLEEGAIDIIVGTHALLDESIVIPDMSFVVIDEQHRFGVYQRQVLREKGENPDVLVMTATPIPRTLALTAYGDLDVSSIRELPKGRKKITTRISRHDEAIALLREEARRGRQGYIVYPAVENNKLELKAAVEMYEVLSKGSLSDIEVGLLHGKMKVEEKRQVMKDFKEGRIKVLVCTTVIEVGIDVPNATVMIIEHAERFGLSTLHQLRGRVGRGAYDSYCCLVTEVRHELSMRRLKALVAYQDGFKLSEEDLLLRGPGDFLGTDQHGFLELRIGSLVHDGACIATAREAAKKLLDEDPLLDNQEHVKLKQVLRERYGHKSALVNVG